MHAYFFISDLYSRSSHDLSSVLVQGQTELRGVASVYCLIIILILGLDAYLGLIRLTVFFIAGAQSGKRVLGACTVIAKTRFPLQLRDDELSLDGRNRVSSYPGMRDGVIPQFSFGGLASSYVKVHTICLSHNTAVRASTIQIFDCEWTLPCFI